MLTLRTCTALAIVLALAPAAPTQTWTGATANQQWINIANWTPNAVPNSASATATFPTLAGATPDYTINIGSSVQAQSLSFSNTSGSYSIAGSTISSLQSISIGSGATTTNSIGSSLSFVGGATPLTITDNAALGASPTLTISGAITDQSTGSMTVGGTGFARISGGIGSGPAVAGLTINGSGRLELTGSNLMTANGSGYGLVLNGGTLAINSDAALGAAGVPVQVNLNSSTSGGLEFLNSGININRPINLDTTTRFICNGTDFNTISGVVTGQLLGATLVKDGTGTLFLSNSNNAQYNNTINAGTLTVTADGQLGLDTAGGSGTITFGGGTLEFASTFATGSLRPMVLNAAGGTIQVDANLTGTVNGTISGTGSLTKTGQGTLILAGLSNSWTGGLAIQQGTVQLEANLPSGVALTLGSGSNSATLDLNGGGVQVSSLAVIGTGTANTITSTTGSPILTVNNNTNQTFSGLLSGSLSLTKSGPGTLTLTNAANSYSGIFGTTIDGGTLAVAGDAYLGASANDLTFGGGTLETTTTFSTGRMLHFNGDGTLLVDAGTTLTLTNTSNGTGGLVKAGGGILLLASAQNYGGGTTLNGGILSTGSNTGLGVLSGGLTFGGGELEWTHNQTSARSVTMNSGGGIIIVDPGFTVTMSGQFSGAGTLTKMGAGTLILSADNSGYSGGVNISSGTLQLGNANALAGSTVTLSSNNVLSFGSLTAAAFGGLNGSGNLALGATNLTVGGNNASTGYTGVLSGTGSLTKTGNGFVSLTGDNSGYTGPVTINGGSIRLGQANALAGSTVTINVANGLDMGVSTAAIGGLAGTGTISHLSNLTVGGNNADTTYSGVFSGPGSLTKTGSGTLTLAADNSNYGGGVTIGNGTIQLGNANALAGSTVTINVANGLNLGGLPAASLGGLAGTAGFDLGGSALTVGGNNASTTFSGAFTGSGSLTKAGAATLTLSGDDSGWAGPVTITGGAIKLGIANALAGSTVTINVNNGLNLGGLATANVGGLAGPGNLNLGSTALSVGGDNASTTYGGLSSGTGPFTKVGTGTLTLSNAANSYTAGTMINGGTLQLGSVTALPAAPVILANTAGATLDLNGFSPTINGLAGGGPAGGTVLLGSGTLTIGTDNSSTTYGGAITGPGTLTKAGTGTLSLGGSGSSVGVLNINAGSLTLGGGSLAVTDNGNIHLNVGGGSATALTVSGGAVLSTTGTGQYSQINGTGAVVTGTGSQLNTSDSFIVGTNASSSLTVQNGGSFSMALRSIALTVGYNPGSTGNLLIQSGGTVMAPEADTGILSGATGTLTVAGSGSHFTAATAIAGFNGNGSDLVQAGAAATSNFTAIANNSGSTGTVTVTGPGSTWMNSINTYLGGNGASPPGPGGTATLTVANGGAFINGGTFYILRSDASTNVNGGTLSVGSFSVANGVTPNLALSDPAGGAALTIGIDNSSSSWTFPFADGPGGPFTVNKAGTGTLTLTGHLTNTGGYTASQGTIDFNGALVQPGSGTLAAIAGATMLYDNGARVFGGYLAGPGTHIVNGATLTGVTSFGSAAISVTGPGSFVNFSNGGPLTVVAGLAAPAVTFTRLTNQGSGSITIGAGSSVNVTDFQTYGKLTLNPGGSSGSPTLLANTGASPMFFNGGSRTFIGTPATAQNNLAGVDLHGQNLVIAGGLFVNNGFVADSTTTPGSVIVDFGALYKGAGTNFVPIVTQNGGKVQAGNSPGSMGFGRFVFGPGGVNNYVFAIDNATGTAGPSPDAQGLVSGWGLVKAVQEQSGSTTTSGDFVWTATPGNKLTFALDTLVNPTMVGTDVGGPMANFDPAQAYAWPAVRWDGTYSGPTDTASLTASTSFDTSGFVNAAAGTFGWSLDVPDHTLSLTYTPTGVPEPGTLTLVGMAAIGWVTFWRRRWQSNGPAVTLSP